MINIHFLDIDEYQFKQSERALVTKILNESEPNVRKLLPSLANRLNVTVYPTQNVIPETGETGRTPNKSYIQWAVDPWDERGIEAIIRKELRKTFYHEANHAARMQKVAWHGTIIADAIFEGLGTAFERDYAKSLSPWGDYDEAAIASWTDELLALNSKLENRQQWFFDHPDGRRWIAYKVGTYVVDQAIKHSDETSATMVNLPAGEILKLAKV